MRASAAMSHFSPMLWLECVRVRARYLVSAPTAHRHSLSTKCRARGAAAAARAFLPRRRTYCHLHSFTVASHAIKIPSRIPIVVRASVTTKAVAPMNGFEHSDEHRPCFYSRTWERGAPFQAPNYSAFTVIIRGAPIKNMDGTSRQHPLQTARGAVGRCVGRQSDG